MKTFKTLSITFALLLSTVLCYSQNFIVSEQPPATENQLFGFAISASDWKAVITAPQKDIGDNQSIGSAFFYERTQNGWEIKAEITPEGIPAFSNFGISAKMTDITAFIGSMGSERGILMEESVFVYEYNDTSWINTQVLRPSDSKFGSRFGQSIDLMHYENLAVIGAFNADGNESKSGAAYVFRKENDTWIEIAKLIADDGESHDYFGHSVLFLDGNQIAVGAYNATGANERSGAVYIFEENGEGEWVQTTKIFDPEGASSDLFGYSLNTQISIPVLVKASDINRYGTLFIGAPGSNNQDGVQTGSVYFYADSEENWVLFQKLYGESTAANDHFGISIAHNDLSGLFIGANRSGNDNTGKIYSYGFYYGYEDITPFSFLGNDPQPGVEYHGTRITSGTYADIIISSPFTSVNGNENSGVVQFFNTPLSPTEEEILGIVDYKLEQNYPNPFNPTTTITYQVKDPGNVKITVFNVLGQSVQQLVNENQIRGSYTVDFDASSLSSGIYFYRLEVNDFVSVKKMMLIK